MQLYLIRHPAPRVAPGVCYGRSDLPLAEPAAVAAGRLRGELPAGLPVVSSPARRCLELAQALHAGEPTGGSGWVRRDPRLWEVDFGDWEGQAWDAIDRAALDAWAADPFGFAPPGGESPAAMAARVVAFADSLDRARDLVVVGHHGPLRVLIAHLLGLPLTASLQLHLDFARHARLDLPSGARHASLRWLNR